MCLSPAHSQKCDNILKGRRQRTNSSSINAQYDPATLGLSRENEPEMGKVTSSNKNPKETEEAVAETRRPDVRYIWGKRKRQESRNTNRLVRQLQAQ